MRILISACRQSNTVQDNNAKLHAMAAYLLSEGIQFEVAVGCYQEEGQLLSTEVTYVCHLNTDGWPLAEVYTVAHSWAGFASTQYGQECVGFLHNGDFYLAYPNAPIEKVGRFVELPTQPKGKPCTFYRGKWYAAEVAE